MEQANQPPDQGPANRQRKCFAGCRSVTESSVTVREIGMGQNDDR
jgi:hypothetical protein